MTNPRRRIALHALVVAVVFATPALGAGGAVAAAVHGTAQRPSVGGARLDGAGPVTDLPAGVPAPPPQQALAWLLADAGTGEVLAAQAAHLPLRPASTQKMLTSLVLLPRLDPGTVYVATQDDANAEGSKVGLVPGAPYTVHELFNGLFLSSGNDAAHALAQVGGGQQATVAAMNALAARLQARDTRAANPSGLDEDTQWSSAYDLALIARAGLGSPEFRSYAATTRTAFPGAMPALAGDMRATFAIDNHNKLLGTYPGAIGVKTGFTSQARGTFVGAATRGGRTLVVTIMHSGQGAWRDAAALMDWGFAHADAIRPVGELVDPLPPPSASASQAVLSERSQAGGSAGASGRSGSGSSARGGVAVAPVVGVGAGALVLLLGAAAVRARTRRRPSYR